MASHHDHHVQENKPVAFTVPLILAIVTLFIMFIVLRACDPEPHGHGDHGHEAASVHSTH